MAKKNSEIKSLTEKIIKFRDARDWEQFDNPKDVALSLVLEASEVVEHFQWKNEEEINKYIKDNKDEIAEELADVLYWVLLLSHDLKINIAYALRKKMTKNKKRYPVKKVKGSAKKYTELR